MKQCIFFASRRTWQFLFFLLICSLKTTGQNPCPNIDFELGNFSNWQGQLGNCCPINTSPSGITNGRHTIMNGAGNDNNSCNTVPVVYPGEGNYSARLGNDNVNSEAEKLSYTFVVPQNSLFIYRYAVILEDPGHDPDDQPRFQISVLDSGGTLIDPICGYYSVVASASIPGFQNCQTVRYKNWTTVGINLSAYIGQSVTIEFSTGDCALGAHFGYAYLDAACSSLQITNSFCSNSTIPAILTAPEGFSYLWSTGETTQSISIVSPQQGTTYSVLLTSVTGCTVTLSSQILATSVSAGFEVHSLCSKEVEFFDTSTVLNATVTGWHWDFGDGNTSTQQNPVHAYSVAGPYQVTLISFTSMGCSDTLHKTVEVIPSPNASFTLHDGCTGIAASLVSTSTVSSGALVSWNWDSGNGFTDTNSTAVFTYYQAGSYTVKLSVVADNNCIDSIVQTINILDFPVVEFSAPDTTGCNPFEVTFIDNSTQQGNTTLSWNWNFGDNTTSTLQHPAHVFLQSGTYNITLNVVNGNGCSTTHTVNNMITVQEHPRALFTAAPEEVSIIYPQVNFQNQSLFSNNWLWDFGDSTSQTGFNAVHTFTTSGHFLVTLVAMNNIGCMDTTSKDIYIKPEMVLFAPNAFTPNGDGRNETFYLASTSVADYYFVVFNRWGEKVFETRNTSDEWNGRYYNNGAASPPGVYYWIAKTIDYFGEPREFSGSVMLLR